MEKLFYVLVGVAIFITVFLGIYYLLWQLYQFVIVALWPSGPQTLLHPSFWVFAGVWFLLTALFGRNKISSKGE